MYAASQNLHVHWSNVFRWTARTASVLLFAAWAAAVVLEIFRPAGVSAKPEYFMLQALTLGMLFAGYAVAWTREVVGSVLTLGGLCAYWAVNFLQLGLAPPIATALFATPALFYLLATAHDRRQQR